VCNQRQAIQGMRTLGASLHTFLNSDSNPHLSLIPISAMLPCEHFLGQNSHHEMHDLPRRQYSAYVGYYQQTNGDQAMFSFRYVILEDMYFPLGLVAALVELMHARAS
jgi:hypothetical protein